MKLNLGSGKESLPGYVNVDKVNYESVDVVADIEKGLPFKDGSVTHVYAKSVFEHIQNLDFLMSEVYRVLVKDGKVEIVVPYYTSISAYSDPSHRRFFTEHTFKYYSLGYPQTMTVDLKLFKLKYIKYKYLYKLPFKKLFRRLLLNPVLYMTVQLEK